MISLIVDRDGFDREFTFHAREEFYSILSLFIDDGFCDISFILCTFLKEFIDESKKMDISQYAFL